MLGTTGTFTSCKDYDDDINNLQSQIDKLATKEDMEAKLSQMQSAINDAKATAEEALKAAQEAGDAEEIAKLEARVKALEDAAIDVDALKKEIADSVEAQMADFREEMEELLKKVEELTGYSLGMVTGISFVATENNKVADPNLNVNYARVKTIDYPENLSVGGKKKQASSYEFGKGLTGAFTIKTGDINTVADYMLINVDPVNAAVSADMLSLINGKGQNLNDYLDLTIGTWSDNITTTRATASTGLREVGVQLKNTVDFDAFDKLVLTGTDAVHSASGDCNEKHEYIAYALAVTDADKSRTVTSPFDVTLHVMEEKNAENIDGKTEIYSSAASSSDSKYIKDWANGGDATSFEDCYPVALDEAFTITVKSDKGRVMASYIEVDYNNSKLSATDKAALKGLTFDGVNTVIKGEYLKHSITIKGIASIAVPLKLVTVDYKGLIQVFNIWVKAGEAVSVVASYTITPVNYVANPEAYSIIGQYQMQAFTIPTGADKYSVELTAGETAHKGDNHAPAIFSNSSYTDLFDNNDNLKQVLTADRKVGTTTDNNQDFLYLYTSNLSKPSKLDQVAYAEFAGKLNLQMMREDKTYKGIIRFYDKTGTYLGANTIQVTKVLPKAVPSDFSAKTNGINNGVMTVYPELNEGNNDVEYLLKRAFNNWENNYSLTIDGVTNISNPTGVYDKGTNKGDASTAKIKNINVGIIHNLKSYPATVKYNYGKISYIPEGHGVETPGDYKVTWSTSFSMQFNCWPVDCTYSWSQTPVVYYRTENIIMGKVTRDADNKVIAFENVIKALDPYGASVDPFDSKDTDWTRWAETFNDGTGQNVEIRLITTNNNGQKVLNEYFTAEFVTVDADGNESTDNTKTLKNAMKLTPTGAEAKPSADVETQVVLRITDKFGAPVHTHDIPALTFTMKINHE